MVSQVYKDVSLTHCSDIVVVTKDHGVLATTRDLHHPFVRPGLHKGEAALIGVAPLVAGEAIGMTEAQLPLSVPSTPARSCTGEKNGENISILTI